MSELSAELAANYLACLRTAEARIDELEAALNRYGTHDPECPTQRRGPMGGVVCECGLDAIRDEDANAVKSRCRLCSEHDAGAKP